VVRTYVLDRKDLRMHNDTLSTGLGFNESLGMELGTIGRVDTLELKQESFIGRILQGTL
jgi:hypothetical protein